MRPELLLKKKQLRLLEDAWLVKLAMHPRCCTSATGLCVACQDTVLDLRYLHQEIQKMKRGSR